MFWKTNQRNRHTVLGLYYRVIALILKNSVPSRISYCTRYNIVTIISVCDNYIKTYFFSIFSQYNSAILFIYRLLACKYRFTRNLSSVYQILRRKNGMQYRSSCNIFNSFGNALLCMCIYKARLVKLYCIFILQRNLHEIFDSIL